MQFNQILKKTSQILVTGAYGKRDNCAFAMCKLEYRDLGYSGHISSKNCIKFVQITEKQKTLMWIFWKENFKANEPPCCCYYSSSEDFYNATSCVNKNFKTELTNRTSTRKDCKKFVQGLSFENVPFYRTRNQSCYETFTSISKHALFSNLQFHTRKTLYIFYNQKKNVPTVTSVTQLGRRSHRQ